MVGCFGVCFGRRRPAKKRNAARDGAGSETRSSGTVSEIPPILSRKNALHFAAEEGSLTVMLAVLENLICQESLGGGDGGSLGSILNARDSQGQTPLWLAASTGRTDCVKFLLTNGADRNIPDIRGNLPLHVAALRGQLHTVILLLEFPPPSLHSGNSIDGDDQSSPSPARATVSAPNHSGLTPLHLAVWGRHGSTVAVLLGHGANLTARAISQRIPDIVPCHTGTTPLHLAATRGHTSIAKDILKSYFETVIEPLMATYGGASPEAIAASQALDPRVQVNQPGQMPWEIALLMGFQNLSAILRPQIPLERLFADRHSDRLQGPHPLRAIAAEALNAKLSSKVNQLVSEEQQRQEAADRAKAEASAAVPAPPLSLPSSLGERQEGSHGYSVSSSGQVTPRPLTEVPSPLPDTNPPTPPTTTTTGEASPISVFQSSSARGPTGLHRLQQQQKTDVNGSQSTLHVPDLPGSVSGGGGGPERALDLPTPVRSASLDLNQWHDHATASPGPPFRSGDVVNVSRGRNLRPNSPSITAINSRIVSRRGSHGGGGNVSGLVGERKASLGPSGAPSSGTGMGGAPVALEGSPPVEGMAGGRVVQGGLAALEEGVENLRASMIDMEGAVRGVASAALEASVAAEQHGKMLRGSDDEDKDEDEEGGEADAAGRTGEAMTNDDECGVCFDASSSVRVRPCNHLVCSGCALKLCMQSAKKACLCPFCRGIVGDFDSAVALH